MTAGFHVGDRSESAQLELKDGVPNKFEAKEYSHRSFHGEHPLNQVLLATGLSDEFLGEKSVVSHTTMERKSENDVWYQDLSPSKAFVVPGSRKEIPLTIRRTSDSVMVEGLETLPLGLVDESLPNWRLVCPDECFNLNKEVPADKWSDSPANRTRALQAQARGIIGEVNDVVQKFRDLDQTGDDLHTDKDTVVVCNESLRGELKADLEGKVVMKTDRYFFSNQGETEVYASGKNALVVNRETGAAQLFSKARRNPDA